ncbi:MAG: tetratricopeptide repeat protein [Chloroflexi bacterium]|nr:tetratricopeptide repeat protein [Chloroflexota bacterium]
MDGVFFIPLADITDPERVVSRIAQTMQVREGGDQPPIETVKGFLRDKSVLLVLDNFEQVAAAAPIITDLLTASARLKVLVTSRVTLQVTGEHELAVPPLAVPKPARMPDLERLGKNESIRLFVERAQAVNSKFALTEENATAVAEICERLDGLPLAIELAAARTKLLPPQAMLSRLDHRLELLTGGARDLPLRQQSLRNSLDLSYSLLRPEEQTLLARLGVFGGGCTLEAAEAVCNADGSLDLLEGLSALINNSLLRPEDGAEGQPRFRMLESIREYALERLEERAELAALQKAHAYYFFSTIASDASTKLYTRESLIWLNWLESEHANIDAALTWGLSNASAAELVSSVIYELTWYWYRRGYLNEGRTWCERVLNSPLAGESTPHRAWALLSSMVLAIWQGDLNTALARGEAGLELARQLEDSSAVAMGLMNLGVANINRGHDATAYEPLKQAEAMFRTTGNAFFYPVTLVHLGNISLGLGNPAEARDWLEKAHAASRSLGEGWVESFVLNNLGEVARVEGDDATARRCYEASEALLRSMGDKGDLARLVHNLGYIAQHEGDLQKAEAQFSESLAMFRMLGNRRGIAECLMAFAGLRAVQEQAPLAARLFGAAEATMEAAGAGWWPADRGEIERTRAAIQSRLDDATFAAERAIGEALSTERAIASAAVPSP